MLYFSHQVVIDSSERRALRLSRASEKGSAAQETASNLELEPEREENLACGTAFGQCLSTVTSKEMKMGLLNKTNAAAGAFESDDDTVAEASIAVETAAPAAEAKTAVAVKPAAQVAVAKAAVNARALESFKDAMPVEYNTLEQIIANQGNFQERESKTNMGDTIVFELLSYQASYVVSPEDEDAPDDAVRYSMDGEVCSDGTMVQEHLEWLQNNGYPAAKVKERAVVVAAIESAAKTDKFNGTLMQLDLSPASRTMWNRFLANAAYGLKIGKYTEESVKRIKAETSIAQGKGNNTYTKVSFTVAP